MRPEFASAVVKMLSALKAESTDRPLAASLDEQTTLALEAFATLRSGNHEVPGQLQSLLFAKLDMTADAILNRLSARATSKPLVWRTSGNRAWPSKIARLRPVNAR